MKLKEFLNLNLTEDEKETFEEEVLKNNISRGKLYGRFVIIMEIILSLIDIGLSFSISGTGFKFDDYLLMYLIMILINMLFLILLNRIEFSINNKDKLKVVILGYIIFCTSWGAVIALMDQKLYGQVMVYMVNVIACSVFYYLDNKTLIFTYLVSGSILFIGLIFFQNSRNVLIGHYVNCIIFLANTWFASRILYRNLYNDFKSKNMVIQANEKLIYEVQENGIIRKELEEANLKLKNLSLNDELTCIHNRRGLTEFINSLINTYSNEFIYLSVIMMDIDDFKLYNDNYGHVKGDEVLKSIAAQLSKLSRRKQDFVGRYGGEEFVYIAVNTDENEILEHANKIIEKINSLKITHAYNKGSNNVSLSLGTATIIYSGIKSIYQCIENADSALYQAKAEGKNRVKVYKN